MMDVLPPDGSLDRDELQHQCGVRRGSAIRRDEFESALNNLEQDGSIEVVSTSNVRRCEPDFKESELEDPVEANLLSNATYESFGVDPERSVFHRSATGGTLRTGRFSRPDFILATIRQRRFDPVRYLDVMTFELKNLAGTSLPAVHETLAHARFAHYSYLVCPRSSLRTSLNEEMRTACATYGLGLVTFRILGNAFPVKTSELKVELRPNRRAPDPDVTEQFLEDRLPRDKRNQLERLAAS